MVSSSDAGLPFAFHSPLLHISSIIIQGCPQLPLLGLAKLVLKFIPLHPVNT